MISASLMEKMKRYIERCLAQGALSLSHLDRIEEKLLEDFGFPTFVAMGFGRFLHFLLHDPAPKAVSAVVVLFDWLFCYSMNVFFGVCVFVCAHVSVSVYISMNVSVVL